jgi:voltage-gated potassium channel
MIFLVISTIFILILEIKNTLPVYIYWFENIAVIIFILEWIARVWVSSDMHKGIILAHESFEVENEQSTLKSILTPVLKKKFSYIFSPMSIIDLLAIIPSYRPLRVLRFFLLFRLFKVFRYTQSANFFLKVFLEKKFEFLALSMIFSFMIFFSSTIIYIFEGANQNENINSFYDAIYWAVVTISTVGYGDISPQTPEGRFVTIILIIGGIATISFMTSIVTTSMTTKLEEVKSHYTLQEVSKLKSYILVCGFGKMGQVLATELQKSGEKFLVLDRDEKMIKIAKKRKYLALEADASDMDILKLLNIDNSIKQAIILIDDDAMNVSIILSLKSLNPDILIFSRVNERSSKKKLKIAGANDVIFPYKSAAIAAYEACQIPIAYDAINDILLENEDPIVDEIEIHVDHKLNRLGLKKHKLKLLGVTRVSEDNRFYFNPNSSDFVLLKSDLLIVIGRYEDIIKFKLAMYKG